MTRNGKIARLPRAIRDELNTRLADGESGVDLVRWLNSLPEVQKVLATYFGGRLINEPNLTEWKQGGFEDWLRHEDARDWVAHVIEESADLERESGALALADRAAAPVALALHRLLRETMAADAGNPAARKKTILAVARQLGHLRRAARQAESLRLQEERWAFKRSRIESASTAHEPARDQTGLD